MTQSRSIPGDIALSDGRPGVWRDEFGHAHCPTCGAVTSSHNGLPRCRCVVSEPSEHAATAVSAVPDLLANLQRSLNAARAVRRV